MKDLFLVCTILGILSCVVLAGCAVSAQENAAQWQYIIANNPDHAIELIAESVSYSIEVVLDKLGAR